MWSLQTCEKTGKGSVTRSSVVAAKAILSLMHKLCMAEFLAELFLREGAGVAPWQGLSSSAGGRGVPCPHRAARAAGLWTPDLPSSHVETALIPPNKTQKFLLTPVTGCPDEPRCVGGPWQAKPSLLMTGAPRTAVCMTPIPCLLLMEPFFTLKALLQGTRAHWCGQAWWAHGSHMLFPWEQEGRRGRALPWQQAGPAAACSGRLQKILLPLTKQLKIK